MPIEPCPHSASAVGGGQIAVESASAVLVVDEIYAVTEIVPSAP